SARPGSYALANLGTACRELRSLTVIATVFPTRLGGIDRPVFTMAGRGGFGLVVAKDGSVCAWIGDPNTSLAQTDAALSEHAWTRVWMTWDAAASALSVGQLPIVRGRPGGEVCLATAPFHGQALQPGRIVLIGADRADDRHATFNGRIERPMLFDRVL